MSPLDLQGPGAPAPQGRGETASPVLEIDDLDVAYRIHGHEAQVLRGVSFAIGRGESFGLVGESGCGKSTLALAALAALPVNGRVAGGSIRIEGREITGLDAASLRDLRAHRVSMVYQDPGRALNPSITVGRQMAEVFELLGCTQREAMARSEAMLGRVRISAPGRVLGAYPHQLSGGMLQRVVIGMALAKDPALLVLDEPTTALDATVEAEILDLVATLRAEIATSVLFISHDLGVIGRMCDRIGVLYAGSLVEEGPTAETLRTPMHPYTLRLLRCLPRAGRSKTDGRLDTIPGFLPGLGASIEGCVFAARCDLADDTCRRIDPPPNARGAQTARCHHWGLVEELDRRLDAAIAEEERTAQAAVRTARPAAARDGAVVLDARNVSKTFRVGGRSLHAVSGVSIALAPGETLGVVGESGSGKTTLARVLLGLIEADQGGEIDLAGETVPGSAAARSRDQQKTLQIVFQNPDSALNRAHTVRHLIGRALSRLAGLTGKTRETRLVSLVDSVRLSRRHLSMRPRQLSGGLKQRVAIARAFAGDPRVVICDEPTSALDVSVQAAILNLLTDLQKREQVSYIFISHDLGVVRYLSDRIVVLYLGRVMEIGPAKTVFDGPHHPYTEALLSAVPAAPGAAEGERIRLEGEIPSALEPPSGCVFHTRCPRKIGAICETTEPAREDRDGHAIFCHIPREKLGRRGAAAPSG